MAEQRIPNPRVGSSNLSTPAIFKALVERLEPFSYLYLKIKATDPLILKTARVGIWGASSVEPLDSQVHPCHILNLRLRVPAAMLGLFRFCGLFKFISERRYLKCRLLRSPISHLFSSNLVTVVCFKVFRLMRAASSQRDKRASSCYYRR